MEKQFSGGRGAGLARLLLLVLLLAALHPAWARAAANGPGRDSGPVTIRSLPGADFDQVWDDLANALADRGLTISSVSRVGEMLQRTGKAIGNVKPIYVRARVMQFCSATLSRRMLAADPRFIVFCPYQIAVYVPAGQPKTVYLAYRRPDWPGGDVDPATRKAALAPVEKLLRELVAEVVEIQRSYR